MITTTTINGLTVSQVTMAGLHYANLTPHDLHLYLIREAEAITIPAPLKADGTQAAEADLPRVSQKVEETTEAGDPFKTFSSRTGLPVNLPPYTHGTFLIVSALLASAAPDRVDLVTVHAVRDPGGRIVGCNGFTSNR